jgi:hypothetical protein
MLGRYGPRNDSVASSMLVGMPRFCCKVFGQHVQAFGRAAFLLQFVHAV